MGEGSDRPLTVITGDRKTRERRAERRRALDQNEQITCWRCENDTGIATSMAVRVILAPRRTPSAQAGTILACVSVRARRPDDARCPQHARHNCLPLRRRLGNLLRYPSWVLGSGFRRSRCWLGYHDWIGNRQRLTAFERPSRVGPTSYATNWPATSIFMPAASTSWTCTKTSEPPSLGAIKPCPRSVLKNLTRPPWHAPF